MKFYCIGHLWSFARHNVCEGNHICNCQPLDRVIFFRSMLKKPGSNCSSAFLIPNICIEKVRWQTAEGNGVGWIQKHGFDLSMGECTELDGTAETMSSGDLWKGRDKQVFRDLRNVKERGRRRNE